MRKTLASICLMGFLALGAAQNQATQWWGKDWKFRRPVTLRNSTDQAFAAGSPVSIEFDPNYLDFDKKAGPDLRDLRLIHKGKEIPYRREQIGSSIRLVFALPEALPAQATDAETYLYYGNATAPAPKYAVRTAGLSIQRFESEKQAQDLFAVSGGLRYAVRNGALEIQNLPPGATQAKPATLRLRKIPPLKEFTIKAVVEFLPNPGSFYSFSIEAGVHKPKGEIKPELKKRIEEFIRQLGAENWKDREEAQKELIRIGGSALEAVEKAARSSDAEVRTRAETILKQLKKKVPVVATGGTLNQVRWPRPIPRPWPPRRVPGGWKKSGLQGPQQKGWPPQQARSNCTMFGRMGDERKQIASVLPRRPVKVVIRYTADGKATIAWDFMGAVPNSRAVPWVFQGSPGQLTDLAFKFFRTQGQGATGIIRIHQITIQPSSTAGTASRPNVLIDVEETRPKGDR